MEIKIPLEVDSLETKMWLSERGKLQKCNKMADTMPYLVPAVTQPLLRDLGL